MKKFFKVKKIDGSEAIVNPDAIQSVQFEDDNVFIALRTHTLCVAKDNLPEGFIDDLLSGEYSGDLRLIKVLRDIYELLRFRLH